MFFGSILFDSCLGVQSLRILQSYSGRGFRWRAVTYLKYQRSPEGPESRGSPCCSDFPCQSFFASSLHTSSWAPVPGSALRALSPSAQLVGGETPLPQHRYLFHCGGHVPGMVHRFQRVFFCAPQCTCMGNTRHIPGHRPLSFDPFLKKVSEVF